MTYQVNEVADPAKAGQRANMFYLLQTLSRFAEIYDRDSASQSEVSDEQIDQHKMNTSFQV